MGSSVPPKFDVHHHTVPEFFNQSIGGLNNSGVPSPPWSVEDSLKVMDKTGVQTAIISLSAPGAMIVQDQQKARALARRWNDYASGLCALHPARFGFFAALPALTDLEGSVEELKYALDSLNADGVTVFTSYTGNYLGSKDFETIWVELNKRNAVVHVHPVISREAPFTTPFLPQALIDFPHETARAASDLVLSGTKRRYSNCKVILSHAGGTLPYIAERLSILAPTMFTKLLGDNPPTSEQITKEVKSFYFDLALGSAANVLDCLLKWAPPDHILYGSDYPYATVEGDYFRDCLGAYEMEPDLRRKCYSENALELFPRFRKQI